MTGNHENWRDRSYSFFSHKDCEYFPCHKTAAPNSFNCLFCFCPLYFTECEGAFVFTADGIKDCSRCLFPHRRENYGKITERLNGARKEGKTNDITAT